MGEVLGIGLTHYPPLAGPDENMANLLKSIVRQPAFPTELRNPESWPAPMQEEWGADQGTTAARRHREKLVSWFRRARAAIDAFRPDFLVIWGDDQYENFQEDGIPPFCILAYESFEARPWADPHIVGSIGNRNVWGEPAEKVFRYRGHRKGGKFLASALLEQGFDVSYAYQPRHHPLGHAFLNTLLYLDYDRKGLDYPVVPFQVNCYGRLVVAQRGGLPDLSNLPEGDVLDPPSPAPWRCFDLGRAVARALRESPWRVALIASSSWSHAFLTAKTHWLHPDIESDRSLYDALCTGQYDRWRSYPLSSLEGSGQQELLNWICLLYTSPSPRDS